jgi:molybdenum cofactor cytidylyltransferase
MSEIGAVVLAAGRSSRYRAAGGPEKTKLVAAIAGQPIIRTVVEVALSSRARPVVVVLGHARHSVEGALSGLPAAFAFNSEFASGIASSLRTGLRAMPLDAAAAIVLLGDMPRIEPMLIDRLIETFEAHPGALVVAPVQDGRRGNPVLIARRLFEGAMRLEGDEGARRLFAGLSPDEIIDVDASDVNALFDIDTLEDLAEARLSQGSTGQF